MNGDDDKKVEEREVKEDDGEKRPSLKPIPGPGAPMVPNPATPDANPIDPRVFWLARWRVAS